MILDPDRAKFLERATAAAVAECDGHAEVYPPEPLGDAYEEPSAAPAPTDPCPEPPDEAAFHGLAGEVVRVIEPQTEAAPVAILAQLLVAFGSAAGRTAYFPVGHKWHHTNLYCVLVGKTAKGRKGTAWSWVQPLFPERTCPGWLDQRVMSGLSSGEGLINEVRDEIRRKDAIVIDGVTDKRLLVVEEEFSSVLRMAGRDGSILSQVIRQAWDSGKLRSMVKNNPTRATDAHISIIGHVSREELRRCLTQTDTANGFANRFLWMYTHRSKCLPDGGDLIDLTELQEQVREALSFARSVGRMKRDAGARELWHQQYPALTAEREGPLGLATNRAEAQVLRLSALYALMDFSGTVREPHLRAALALWDYCARSCRWIFGDRTGNDAADRILDALRDTPGGLNKTEIGRLFGGNKPAVEIDRALAILVEQGLVIPGRAAAGGKPAQKWKAKGVDVDYSTLTPEEVWQATKGMTPDQRKKIYDGLPEELRQRVWEARQKDRDGRL